PWRRPSFFGVPTTGRPWHVRGDRSTFEQQRTDGGKRALVQRQAEGTRQQQVRQSLPVLGVRRSSQLRDPLQPAIKRWYDRKHSKRHRMVALKANGERVPLFSTPFF